MAKNTRNYPKKEDEEVKETIRKLKAQIRKLQRENRELRSEAKTMQDAWLKTEAYLSEVVEEVPLEELLKQEKILDKQLVGKHKDTDKTREQVRQKWASWNSTRKKEE